MWKNLSKSSDEEVMERLFEILEKHHKGIYNRHKSPYPDIEIDGLLDIIGEIAVRAFTNDKTHPFFEEVVERMQKLNESQLSDAVIIIDVLKELYLERELKAARNLSSKHFQQSSNIDVSQSTPFSEPDNYFKQEIDRKMIWEDWMHKRLTWYHKGRG